MLGASPRLRLLWGFLVREGTREHKALSLTWECVDLKRGAICLDKNKTDDPRSWALDAGVVRALLVYRECSRSDASASGLVFVSPNGEAISKLGLAELLRAHLEAIGLKQSVPSSSPRTLSAIASGSTTSEARW